MWPFTLYWFTWCEISTLHQVKFQYSLLHHPELSGIISLSPTTCVVARSPMWFLCIMIASTHIIWPEIWEWTFGAIFLIQLTSRVLPHSSPMALLFIEGSATTMTLIENTSDITSRYKFLTCPFWGILRHWIFSDILWETYYPYCWMYHITQSETHYPQSFCRYVTISHIFGGIRDYLFYVCWPFGYHV